MKTRIERQKKNNFIAVTCTTEQKEKLNKLADKSGRTMAGYVRYLIEEAIKREENND